MRDRFAVRIRGAGVTGRSPLPVVASAQPLKFVERQPANVPDIFQFSFRRLRPSLVAHFNEGCKCSLLVSCCLMGARLKDGKSTFLLRTDNLLEDEIFRDKATKAPAGGCHARKASILETAEDRRVQSESRLCPYPDNFATTGCARFIFLIGRDVSSFHKTGPASFLAPDTPLGWNSCGRQANCHGEERL
jgi:hypothetical protein